eukprot:TRINITY_DN11849_c0_g1_i1.p1 TRINITY_DN11849_c0_g1~~TRINITY_DN11849_c0_g1_i1.p1  ORF type:complete len:578 (-),score=96.90 TRINITY_DN11849_c0_g1_i1:15-1748(-)
MDSKILKIVFVGNCGVGKTSLIRRYMNPSEEFTDVQPTSIETVSGNIKVNNYMVRMSILDVGGSCIGMNEVMAAKLFINTDIFFICFTEEDLESINDAVTTWKQLIVPFMKDSCVFLVSCKSDLIEVDTPIDILKGINFIRCSSNNNEGISHLFALALRWVITKWENPSEEEKLLLQEMNEDISILSIVQDPVRLSTFHSIIKQKHDLVVQFINFDRATELIHNLLDQEKDIRIKDSICDLICLHFHLFEEHFIQLENIDLILLSFIEETIDYTLSNILLRILTNIMKKDSKVILEYALSIELVDYLLKNPTVYGLELFTLLMECEKLIVENGYEHYFFKDSNTINYLGLGLKNVEDLSVVTQFLDCIKNTRGRFSIFFMECLKFEASVLIETIFEKINSGANTSENVNFLIETLIKIKPFLFEEPIEKLVHTALVKNKSIIGKLLKSESTILKYCGLKLCDILVSCELHKEIVEEFIKDCLGLMFDHQKSSIILNMVTNMIIFIFGSEKCIYLQEQIIKDSHFCDMIVESCENNPTDDFMSYIPFIVHSLVTTENKKLLEDEINWNNFVVGFVQNK